MTNLIHLWKLRHSALTNNIVVLLMVFGITPLAIIFLVFQHVFISQEKEAVERLQKENAFRVADQISSCINQSLSHLDVLIDGVGKDFPHECLAVRLNEFLIQNPEFDQITVMDSQGREIGGVKNGYSLQGSALGDRNQDPLIQQALSGKSSVPPGAFLGDDHIPRINLVFPVKNAKGEIVGVLEAWMKLVLVSDIISKYAGGGNCHAYIISSDGHFIAGQNDLPHRLKQDLTKLPIVRSFVEGRTGVWNYNNVQNQYVIGASTVVPTTGWGVIVEKSSSEAFGQIHRIATFFLGLFAFTMFAAVIRGLIFSQDRIIGPVKALQQEIESLSQGVFPQGLTVAGKDEMGQLSQAFNQMVDYLKETMVSRDLLAQEVAERRIVEEALRRREATLRSIFLAVPLGIGSLRQWALVGGNDFFYKITGYPKEEIRGKNLNCLFSHQNDYKKMVIQLRRTLTTKETAAMETKWRRRDGQERDIFLKFAALDKNDVESDLVFAAMDISDLRKMEQERLRIDKLESLGVMAGGIAHDFNNILTIILGNIELVGLEIKKADQSLDRLLEAEQACQRAKQLAKQLLTFAKGGMPVKKTVVVSELLEDVVPLALSGSNSAVEIVIEENIWSIDIDEDQIYQVINNILINADQAMPRGGLITIKVNNQSITAASSLPLADGDYVRFSIIDQGIGISEKDLGKIFDPYFTTKQLGNGLGLTAAFSIVKNHQGHISVESEIGQGSSFHIYLPAARKVAPAKSIKVSTLPIRGHGRILVMDDEPAIRTVLHQMLQKLGYEAVCVDNGEQALEAYQAAHKNGNPFDAVILDLTIPGGLGGKETLAFLRHFDPQIKAIVSSGYGDDPIMANYEKYGFKNVIAKPYKISDLSFVLHNVLSKQQDLLGRLMRQLKPPVTIKIQ